MTIPERMRRLRRRTGLLSPAEAAAEGRGAGKGVDVDREPAGGQRDRELGSILPANIGNR